MVPKNDLRDNPQSNNSLIDSDDPKGPRFHIAFRAWLYQHVHFSNIGDVEPELSGLHTRAARRRQSSPLSGDLGKYLIPSKCDETAIRRFETVTCFNTPRTVNELKACHGRHHGWWGASRTDHEKWSELT